MLMNILVWTLALTFIGLMVFFLTLSGVWFWAGVVMAVMVSITAITTVFAYFVANVR